MVSTSGDISEIEIDKLSRLFDGTFEAVFKRNEIGGHEVS